MEELTKTQIVLLTLLVSFVTSIATGIVTVALVDQSSAGVGQTIQTVIQRTIETVVPGDTDENTSSADVTPPPSESDLIVAAVAKNSASLVRIKKTDTVAAEAFVGLGIIISKSGTIMTDHGLLAAAATYVAVFPDGKVATLTPSTINNSTNNAAFFTFIPPAGGSLSVATLGNSDGLSLGQKVVSLSGAEKNVVQVGVVSDFNKGSTDNNKAFINTDLDATSKAFGSIIINLSGGIVGMKTAASVSAASSYQAINALKAEIK